MNQGCEVNNPISVDTIKTIVGADLPVPASAIIGSLKFPAGQHWESNGVHFNVELTIPSGHEDVVQLLNAITPSSLSLLIRREKSVNVQVGSDLQVHPLAVDTSLAATTGSDDCPCIDFSELANAEGYDVSCPDPSENARASACPLWERNLHPWCGEAMDSCWSSEDPTMTYPRSYGASCSKHITLLQSECFSDGVELNWNDRPAECDSRWCYIDPCNCRKNFHFDSLNFPTGINPSTGEPRLSAYFSYQTCMEDQGALTVLVLEHADVPSYCTEDTPGGGDSEAVRGHPLALIFTLSFLCLWDLISHRDA